MNSQELERMKQWKNSGGNLKALSVPHVVSVSVNRNGLIFGVDEDNELVITQTFNKLRAIVPQEWDFKVEYTAPVKLMDG